MSKLKIGVLGAGRGMTMMRVLLNHPDAELVAVCDSYEPVLKNAREHAKENNLDIALYNDFDEFLRHDIDAVVLANFAHQHAPYAIRALKAGKHVMSEVLPCATIAEGIQLIEAVEESGLVYAYAENYCYMQDTFEMWHRVKSGEFGEISYAEGAYVHDTTDDRPMLTFGDKNHWRNHSHVNFYCTHSLGPMLTVIGKRPVSVVGYELPDFGRGGKVPCNWGNGGIEMVTLENGCVCRSLHGGLRRERARNTNFVFYGDFGTLETSRFYKDNGGNTVPVLNIYKEGEEFCRGEWKHFDPTPRIPIIESAASSGHGGSDFYPTHFFIEKILGRPDGLEWSIGVYDAVEMGICGTLALRSRLQGGIPMDVPNFRNKAERDPYRDDWDTTHPGVENGRLVPRSVHTPKNPPDDKYYDYLRSLYEKGYGFVKYDI